MYLYRNKTAVIADLGCGDAKIARVLTKRTVHSFDLVAMHKCVTACDVSKVRKTEVALIYYWKKKTYI